MMQRVISIKYLNLISSFQTDKATQARYLALDQPKDRIQVMYVWVDGTGEQLRAKTKTVEEEPTKPDGMILNLF